MDAFVLRKTTILYLRVVAVTDSTTSQSIHEAPIIVPRAVPSY